MYKIQETDCSITWLFFVDPLLKFILGNLCIVHTTEKGAMNGDGGKFWVGVKRGLKLFIMATCVYQRCSNVPKTFV